MSHLQSLQFDNRLLRELPVDPDTANRRRQVFGAVGSRVKPTTVARPQLVAFSAEMMEALGLDPSVAESPEFAAVFAGNHLVDGMDPYAACYGGHQFGGWAGQLGDGRAITLGEVVRPDGQRWELQLKGAGPTPFSRMGDGRAVLRSSIREFLCSEAMHYLGIPTTRALSLVTTGDQVVRDMFYDGRPAPEPGAICCRVAPSFLRFGNFEIFAARGDVDTLRLLVAFCLRRDFGHPEDAPVERRHIVDWLAEVCRRTAHMVLGWMRVGFVHGVMNTDNMSVLGLTIDYGPYGWLDDFDTNWTPNTTDFGRRRYRFGSQPQVALWNLVRFANALYPLVEEAEPLEEALGEFTQVFDPGHSAMLASKLGLSALPATDSGWPQDLFRLLQLEETDMTLFWRGLADVAVSTRAADALPSAEALIAPLAPCFYSADGPTESTKAEWVVWLRGYVERVRAEGVSDRERKRTMNAVNPRYVMRNYLAQMAIDKAQNEGDTSMVAELLDVMRRPYDDQPERVERFGQKRPEWARNRPGCSTLSCSS